MVLGLCRGLLRDRVEAEDAAQQTFLSAHRALLNGAEPREPAAWLATIARNECWARTSARMREPLPTDGIEDVAASSDPVQEAIRRADLHALWLAIKQLPRQQRDALLLREFGGLRYDELAVALAVSEPSVESLLFRARSSVRERLEPVVRLFLGGGLPAFATKAVALTVGAAAVTGGAVVAPQMLERRPHAQPVRVRTHVVHHVAVVTQAQPAPRVEAAVTPPPVRRVVAPRTREHDHEHERERHGSREGSGDGDANVVTVVRPTTTPTTSDDHRGRDGGGHDGEGGGGGDDGSDG